METYFTYHPEIISNLIMQTDNHNYVNDKWTEEYLTTKTKIQTNKNQNPMSTKTTTEEKFTIANKPLWKCSPQELRTFCDENKIQYQEGLKQYELAAIVKKHLTDKSEKDFKDAKAVIDERTARARKMVVPSGITTKEEKKKEKAEKKAPANVKELKERADIKAILTADAFKKEKIQSLGKLGLDRFTIAELCETNQGHVWNVLNTTKKEA